MFSGLSSITNNNLITSNVQLNICVHKSLFTFATIPAEQGPKILFVQRVCTLKFLNYPPNVCINLHYLLHLNQSKQCLKKKPWKKKSHVAYEFFFLFFFVFFFLRAVFLWYLEVSRLGVQLKL